MSYQMQIRRDTATNWTSVNPTLAQGELGHETNTNKLKIGDGLTAWSTLPYFWDSTGYVASSRLISTQYSLTGGGDLSANRTLNLVNDVATPGIGQYYGTDPEEGVRGWYDLPTYAHGVTSGYLPMANEPDTWIDSPLSVSGVDLLSTGSLTIRKATAQLSLQYPESMGMVDFTVGSDASLRIGAEDTILGSVTQIPWYSNGAHTTEQIGVSFFVSHWSPSCQLFLSTGYKRVSGDHAALGGFDFIGTHGEMYRQSDGLHSWYADIDEGETTPTDFTPTILMSLSADSLLNVGPYASLGWTPQYATVQLGRYSSISTNDTPTDEHIRVGTGWYLSLDEVSPGSFETRFKYAVGGGYATQYEQISGVHSWYSDGLPETADEVFTPTIRMQLSAAGALTLSALTAAGILHNSALGVVSSSTVVDADISVTASIALTKLASVSTGTLLGNNSGSAAAPGALTSSQATAMLDTFSSTLKGLAPLSGGGTTHFLRADGTWSTPEGTAPGGSNTQIQFNDSGVFGGVSGFAYAKATSILSLTTAGAASAPVLTFTGAPYTGGTSTTTKPMFLMEPTGAASTGWATAGTFLGINQTLGSTCYFIDCQINGAFKFRVASNGNVSTIGMVSAGSLSAGSASFGAGLLTISDMGDITAIRGNATSFPAANAAGALTNDGSGTMSYVPYVKRGTSTLTDGATIATDASLASHFRVTLGGNRTLSNPTNGYDGQKVVWEIIQDATGSRTLSLGTNFALGTDVSSVTLSTTAGKRDFLGAFYNSTAGKWYVTAFVKGY